MLFTGSLIVAVVLSLAGAVSSRKRDNPPLFKFPPEYLLDTNNATDHGCIVNETRLVLQLDFSPFAVNESWFGIHSRLIYDLSIDTFALNPNENDLPPVVSGLFPSDTTNILLNITFLFTPKKSN
ncbi:hypothetical protein NA57DRAFT_80745 [Rhizodiscina lignyota]|uniref:Uncharacterized protein n=1 Tax=Rhizodiscina lignyota TaxID=1504668 RepID=A0A9P4M3Y3_9PEZI|nr:hypothetical protein NA57DRAFT_80745 [Rhizodiscina lignyota]